MIDMLYSNKLEVHLEPDVHAPSKARSAIHQTLVGVNDETAETALLLVSELVTNSVRHAGLKTADTVVLCIQQGPRGLHFEVQDVGIGFEHHKRRSSKEEPGGWGLYLVEQLAQRWGVNQRGPTVVWFELDLLD